MIAEEEETTLSVLSDLIHFDACLTRDRLHGAPPKQLLVVLENITEEKLSPLTFCVSIPIPMTCPTPTQVNG